MNEVNNMIIERKTYDNGGYQIRLGENKILIDICKDNKFMTKEKPIIEYYAWLLSNACKELVEEVGKYISKTR